MKTLLFSITLICISIFATAQTDSLATYLNMSFEELLKQKVTTAGKQDQKISDVPASVMVITREEIEAYGYQSLKEILSNVLGMYMTDNYQNISFGVRGFYSNASNRNIVFLINGVAQQTTFNNQSELNRMNLQVESIDRIEVIKGPSAIIYGNNAFFGAINIITHSNVAETKSSVTSAYGSNNTYRSNLQVNSSTGKTDVNLSAGFLHTDGRDIPFKAILDSVVRWDNTWIKDGTTKDYFRQNSNYFNLSMNHQGIYANLSYDETDRNLIQNFPPVYDTTKISKRENLFRAKIGYRKK